MQQWKRDKPMMSQANAKTRLTVEEAAEFIGVQRTFLDRRRTDGTGPRYLKLGSRVFYSRADLEAWLEAQMRTSTARAS